MEGLTLVVALLASQADAGAPLPASEVTVVVRKLEGNEAAGDLVAGLSALMTERVKTADPKFKVYAQADIERVLGIERQAQLLGCSDQSCLAELSDALGARYAVSGRLDRFGDRYILVASLWDSQKTSAKVAARREVTDPGKLPAALDEVADEVLAPLGVEPRTTTNLANRYDTTGFSLGLKFSTQIVTSLSQLAPGGDLEIGYRITPGITFFFQISFVTSFGSSGSFGNTQLVPGLLGGRYYFRSGKSFQPYIGAGLGLVVTVNAVLGKGTRPSLWVQSGAAYLFLPWLGATLDFGVDVLGAVFELVPNSEKKGVNLAFSFGVLFRF